MMTKFMVSMMIKFMTSMMTKFMISMNHDHKIYDDFLIQIYNKYDDQY